MLLKKVKMFYIISSWNRFYVALAYCIPGWPQIHRDLCISALCQVLGLKEHNTTPGFTKSVSLKTFHYIENSKNTEPKAPRKASREKFPFHIKDKPTHDILKKRDFSENEESYLASCPQQKQLPNKIIVGDKGIFQLWRKDKDWAE